MGRTFENRKNAILKRGARDAKAFTKAGRQLSLAVKGGGSDPDINPKLRRAVQNARAVGMPKEKIFNAIEKAAGAASVENFEEIIYEGYGPHGAAFIVEVLTDNPTRTVANIRFAFKKAGGSMGSTGSVAFMFDHFGAFTLDPESLEGKVDKDTLELELIDHGLERLDVGVNDDGDPVWVLLCSRDAFGTMQAALEARKLPVASSGFKWMAKSPGEITEAQSEDLVALYDMLEDDDDVQNVFCNVEVAGDGVDG